MVFGLWRLAFLEAVEAKNALLYRAQAAGESGLTVLQARADSQSKATLYHTQSGNACVDIHHDSQRQACCGGHDQGRCSMCGARQSSERRIPTRALCQGDARRHRTSRSHAGRGGGAPWRLRWRRRRRPTMRVLSCEGASRVGAPGRGSMACGARNSRSTRLVRSPSGLGRRGSTWPWSWAPSCRAPGRRRL